MMTKERSRAIGTFCAAPHFTDVIAQRPPALLRFRIRQDRRQIGPWHPTDEAAEQAAITLGLARRDAHYDLLHLDDGVVIDCEDSPEAGDAASAE